MTARGNGFALVAVLVVLTIAAALAAAALTLANTAVGSATGYAAEMEGGHAANAAIRLTAIRLADAEGNTLAELSPGRIDWMGWQVAIRVEDEAGKYDLNRSARSALMGALRGAGVPAGAVGRALADPGRRFVSLDEFAGLLGADTDMLSVLRQRFTVYGDDAPQPAGPRSPLETYRIVARAVRGDRTIVRWAIVRLSPGFGEPFEWLERGTNRDDFKPSRKLTET